MFLKNYDQAVQALLPRLSEYLQSQGIDTSQNFTCLNPEHEDKNPSCGLTPNGEAFHCFSCNYSGTILNACAILENKPSTGPEFIHETLVYLADKYEVPIKKEEPTEEELYRIDTYKAYRLAGELVVNGTPTETFSKAIETRGWSADLCRELGIGFVKDFKDFKDNLRLSGFSNKFLAEIDLNRDTIFGSDRIIFTIRDENGSPVGFASRNLGFEKDNGDSKYVNQRSTGVKCNIYQKSKRLFGFDRFLKKRGKKQKPVYIFEGYSDVATAAEHGHWNSVAVGGVALTLDHIHLLKQKNVYDIILCLDGDDKGQEATARLLDTVLAGHKDLNIKIVIIPNSMDPDEFIRSESIQKFRRLKKHSAFEWRLSKFEADADPEDMCQKMIPLIVNECSYIKQEQMAKELANLTGYTLKNIQKELDRIQNQREAEKARDINEVGERLIQGLKKDPQSIQFLLQEADTSLYDLSRRYEEDAFSVESMVSRIRSQKEYEESLDGSFSGFVLGPDMYDLQEALAGQWKKDVWLMIGGGPNAGKTTWITSLAYEIARHEIENDALVIYHTIDDTFEQLLPKFVALASESNKLELNMVMNPNYAIRDTGDSDNSIIEDRDQGYNEILELAKKERLIIKDANDGQSIAFADHMIRRFRERFPDRNIVYILDNFHKCEDYKNAKGDERVRFKTLSQKVKQLAGKHHITVISTIEYVKLKKGERPDNASIAESRQLEYDANLIAHIYNEAHELGAAATTCHRGLNDEKLPILELDIAKNKITSFKNRLYFKFWPAHARFKECSAAVVHAHKKAEKERLGQDDTISKEVFQKCAKVVQEKGWQPGKVFWMLFDELSLNKDNEEDKEKVNTIWSQFGGAAGVERIWNGQ